MKKKVIDNIEAKPVSNRDIRDWEAEIIAIVEGELAVPRGISGDLGALLQKLIGIKTNNSGHLFFHICFVCQGEKYMVSLLLDDIVQKGSTNCFTLGI